MFKRSDSDLIVAKLFVQYETSVWLCRITHIYALLRRSAPNSVVCPYVCRSVSLSHERALQNGWNDQVVIWVQDSGGPNEPRVYMRSICQHWKAQFWGVNRQTIVKYRHTSRSSVQTRLNRSRCRLGCELAWARGIVCYMGSICPIWRGNSGGYGRPW